MQRYGEDTNEEWVDLVKVTVLDIRGAVDPLHIRFGLQVDFGFRLTARNWYDLPI